MGGTGRGMVMLSVEKIPCISVSLGEDATYKELVFVLCLAFRSAIKMTDNGFH